MKTLKELYRQLHWERKFSARYPGYDPQDGKIHVLYVGATLNDQGYYRMILPAMELSRSGTHQGIVANLHKWDFNKSFEQYDNPIDERLIRWADFVVMPALFCDILPLVKGLRQVNDNLNLVMDVDINYNLLPAAHPLKTKMGEEGSQALLSNLAEMDLFTAPSMGIVKYYEELLEQSGAELVPYGVQLPNLLSDLTLQEITLLQRGPSERIRIGMAVDQAQVENVRMIEPVIRELMAKYAGQIELVVFGWTEKKAAYHALLQGLPIRYERSVAFADQLTRLNELQIDIALIPLTDTPFNRMSASLVSYLNFSSLMIPVVASPTGPYKKVIRSGQTGLLANSEQEWLEQIGKLISDPSLREQIGNEALRAAWENLSYSSDAIRHLTEIYN